jgi:hypothetical protein
MIGLEMRLLARRASAVMFEVEVNAQISAICAYPALYKEPARLSRASGARRDVFARRGLRRLRVLLA